ncbi:hypothetical protein UFOVP623_29 [uncultured Caudovirales phage]|uniref:Uncharacterized protein n=1 Tax=uncultured Caudovirales phage TaxID=2100421 RepID=A0A6J5N1C9_9CAUD|nr:hypothetical protein UFOVP623_29 [uncultured Caudovirales phage]
MSDINLQFTVNRYSANITTTTNSLTIRPLATQLTMSAGFAALPTTQNSEVTFNDEGTYGGTPLFVYNKDRNTLTVSNANISTTLNATTGNITNINATTANVSGTTTTSNLSVSGYTTLGSLTNVIITGGTSNQFIRTDGSGTLTFTTIPVVQPGGSNTQLQYNSNGAFAGIPGVTYASGNLSLGTVSNVKLTGGTNGQYLQTDGTGNLAWGTPSGNGGGNTSPGGSNTQVQYNNNSAFGGTTTFTFNNTTNTLSVTNIVASGAGLTNLPAANIVGAIANANYAGNSNNSNYAINANYANFAGTAFSVSASNITGQVANATVAGTVYTNAQPNITSLGTLTSLSVAGTSSIQQAIEKVTLDTVAAIATFNFDVLTSAILYKTNSGSTNYTINIRGNSTVAFSSVLAVGQSLTCTFINTSGSPAYYMSGFQIDGASVTPTWTTSVPTSGQANTKDMYSFNIVRTSGGYVVFATRGVFL